MEKPEITVLMSCYNDERWLKESIQSILDQTFKDFEFIIINDGSTDQTWSIIKEFEKLDDRIRVFEKPNSGLADSLNKGVALARGSWIARLDADDISEPSRLEEQYQAILRDPKICFLGTGLKQISENGEFIAVHTYPSMHDQLVQNLLNFHKFPPHSSAFIKTKLVKSLGGFRSRMKRAQDKDLWLRISETGRLSCLKEPLVKIRQHPSQVSNKDQGKWQIFYSRMALVCYYLRMSGYDDPLDADEYEFQMFQKWYGEKMESYGLYDFYRMKEKVKKRFFGRISNKVTEEQESWFQLLLRLPKWMVFFVLISVNGENVSKKISQDWIDLKRDKQPITNRV